MVKLTITNDSDFQSNDKVPDHLGGHQGRSHTDEGTLDYLIDTFNIKSMIDVGQGPGGMVQLARQKGLEAVGVDGDPTVQCDLRHDFSTGPLKIGDPFDLAWSVEFLEHVNEEYVPNFMETFRCAKYVFVTGAKPGEPGHHHVNCQPAHYWISAFAAYGYVFDLLTTNTIRNDMTTMNIDRDIKKQFVKRNGLFFIREDLLVL
jgi:hypothetical protein